MKHTQTQPDIPIVFEDDHLLIIDKPANLLSQKDHTGDPDVLTLCKQYLQRSKGAARPPYLGLVHRLDRPVSGLMLLAKTSHAAQSLARQINDRTVQKTYWAVTGGRPPTNGMLTHYLLKKHDKNIVQVASSKNKKAKKAILSFVTIDQRKELNLLSIHLQTGRPHQIRVQLASEGYPIWGDYKYGIKQPDGRHIALRAAELALRHPITGEHLHFEAEPPKAAPWSLFTSAHSPQDQDAPSP
ncbi:RluA family pseudouridine synthase [Fodinibius sediminis]|uniref:Ribosomal large subunit pseudouridine synthase D n=1 Tax=Fodinibius sediminis TaxID=1214077 RepID=A0A521B0Q1_9BACT|nr:RluA family pseudouridine synthase [Fodinibius sediminis]SMO40678.1 ribosomal large subunit pseudouridine synthase D [Fodinibius sediminis]